MDLGGSATFGELLRHYRRSAGLTQEQLAELARLSWRGISDLERGARTAPRKETVRLLAAALALAPADLERLERAAHRPAAPPDTAPPPAAAAPRHNLPLPPTDLIGRETEQRRMGQLLARHGTRLRTLSGPGGTGKTRLALAVARQALDLCADGVFMVDLAPLRDPELLLPTIATTLGLQESAGQPSATVLHNYLREKQILLLLDNFEQLLAAAPAVAALLQAAPDLKLLVTSRQRLQLQGEQEFIVPPLALPQRHAALALEQLTQYAAVALFIARARDARADFAVTNENAPAVAEITHRLDGLPLAIELAAVRAKIFTPQALLARLSSALNLLTGGAVDLPPRQRTLRSAIAWSHELLIVAERVLFRRLAVFSGGCTLAATAAVCADPALDPLDGLIALVDASLLYRVDGPDGEPRFLLLETIHEYAREQLAASGEAEQLALQHATYYGQLAVEAEPHLYAAEQLDWLRRLDADHDNFRRALDWSLHAGQAELAGRLSGALGRFWDMRGHYMEGHRWLELALAQAELAAATRAHALRYYALAKNNLGDYAGLAAIIDETVQLNEQSGSPRDIAAVLLIMSSVYFLRGELAAVGELSERALTIAQAASANHPAVTALVRLSAVQTALGRTPPAHALLERALSLAHQAGDRAQIALVLVNLGLLAKEEQDYAAAAAYYRSSLALNRELGRTVQICYCLGNLALAVMCEGDFAEADALLAESLRLADESGTKDATAFSLSLLGESMLYQGNLAAAEPPLEQSLALHRMMLNESDSAWMLLALGKLRVLQSDFSAAVPFLVSSLNGYRQVEDAQGAAACVEWLAAAQIGRTQLAAAVALFAAAAALRDTTGALRDTRDHTRYEHDLAAARTQLDPVTWDTLWTTGRATPLAKIVAELLPPRAVD